MSIPKPTRAECAVLLKEMRMRRIGDDATLPRVTTGYLALLDENEALRAEVTRLNGVILKAAVQTVDDSQ